MNRELIAFAKPIFLRWEKWRIAYNLCLLAMLVFSFVGTKGDFWDALNETPYLPALWLLYATLANFCFFAAPIADSYASWLGFSNNILRITMFSLGVFVSLPLVLLCSRGFPLIWPLQPPL